MDPGIGIAKIAVFIPIIGIITGNAVLFILIYTYLRNKNKERLALIEKGMDASFFFAKKEARTNELVLKYGIFLVGLALGALAGFFLNLFTGIVAYVAYPSMILLFGGLALIVYYIIDKQKAEKRN